MRSVFFIAIFLFGVSALLRAQDNIAHHANVTASTSLNEQTAATNVADQIIMIDGKGEWACEGVTTDWGYIRFPWIELKWKTPQLVNRIVLYDRPSLDDNIAGGKLLFSDSSVIWVNEIPANGHGKNIVFSPKKTEWIKFIVTDGTGKDLGFSEIEVYAAPSEATDFVSWVDPYIETNRGRYFFFVTGSLPFGMASAAPHTRNKNQNGGGYNYNESEILGFGQLHDWMVGGIEIMPATSEQKFTEGEAGWKSHFSHDDEIVRPGYQRVLLRNNNVWTEQTTTDRVSFYRFTYTEKSDARIVVNLGGKLPNCTMENATVTRVNDRRFEGSVSSTKRYWGGPKDVKLFFVVEFDKPMRSLDTWQGRNHVADITSADGDSLTVTAAFDLQKGEAVQMKIGLSYTTVENARKNLAAECSTWDFDAVKNNARKIWNEWLGNIEVRGGTDAQKIKFYTDLWHVLLGRHKTNDINGDYPDRTTGKRDGNFTDAIFKIKNAKGFNMYNSDALWLTHWNLNILWGLAWPGVVDDFSASMLEYARNGYLLPRGPSGGGYSYIMTSSPTSNLIVSAYMKGLLRKSRTAEAYEIVKRNHLPGGMLGSEDEIKFYTKNRWWPDNAGITIEAAFQDWGIAQMARRLKRKKDYQFFLDRSTSWKNCFDSSQKLLFPKDRQGRFTHSDPLSGSGWVEANAWQATWGVSHAIPELVQMMGGADTFCNRLNHAFEMAAPSDFVFGYNDGYVSYANQPGCSNAHVFSYAGKPWLTQYWVRRVKEQAYGGITPDLGYGGHDEDQGQMGGVSALMAIGLFSITGNQSTTPVYEITSPVFDEVIIHLDSNYYSGKKFVIKTKNNSAANCYIQSAALNGKKYDRFWFNHTDFAKGGTLELVLGDKPNKEWGAGALPPM